MVSGHLCGHTSRAVPRWDAGCTFSPAPSAGDRHGRLVVKSKFFILVYSVVTLFLISMPRCPLRDATLGQTCARINEGIGLWAVRKWEWKHGSLIDAAFESTPHGFWLKCPLLVKRLRHETLSGNQWHTSRGLILLVIMQIKLKKKLPYFNKIYHGEFKALIIPFPLFHNAVFWSCFLPLLINK